MKNFCDLCGYYSPSGCAKLYYESCIKEMPQLIKEGTINGDMITLMFPDYKFTRDGSYMHIIDKNGRNYSFCPVEFWNALYNGGNNESIS